MKKKVLSIAILLLFILSACQSSGSISVAELTEREESILTSLSTQYFVYDYEVGGKYNEVSGWIEKYIDGELVEKDLGQMSAAVKESGSIFLIARMAADGIPATFDIGVSSQGDTVSGQFSDASSLKMEEMASIWQPNNEENISTQGEILLGSICYSSDANMTSLSVDFFENPEENMDELKEYDVTYLFKAEFIE